MGEDRVLLWVLQQSLRVTASFQVPELHLFWGILSITYPSPDPLVVTAISTLAHHTLTPLPFPLYHLTQSSPEIYTERQGWSFIFISYFFFASPLMLSRARHGC